MKVVLEKYLWLCSDKAIPQL